MLPTAPPTPVSNGTPAFGRYAGRCAETDLAHRARGVSRLRRAISDKRWQWFCAIDESVAVGGAIVDAGLIGTAFLWVFDREEAELVQDTEIVVPSRLLSVSQSPGDGQIARIALPRRQMRISRNEEALQVNGKFGETTLSLRFESPGRALTAICPVPGRSQGVNVTQKETGATVNGYLNFDGGRRLSGSGLLDYTHGLLARETAWRWAIGNCETATGETIGFNLVEGFNDGLENAIWRDGEPQSVDAATIEATENSAASWDVSTACETVDLTLVIDGCRTQDMDIGIVSSQYCQPLGRWSGTIAGEAVEGVGVAEDHRSRW